MYEVVGTGGLFLWVTYKANSSYMHALLLSSRLDLYSIFLDKNL